MPEPVKRVYCAVAQPFEGGAPITAITTVHIEDVERIEAERDRMREQRDMALGLVDACATFIGDKGHPDEAGRIIERAKGLSDAA